MGLFSSKSSQSSSVVNQTSSTVNDDRIGIGDGGDGVIATDGGSIIQNITQNNQVVSDPALVALATSISGTLDSITATTGALVDGAADAQGFARDVARDAAETARELFDRSAGIASDAIRNSEYSLEAGLNFGRDALSRGIGFAEVTQENMADLFDTFGDRLDNQADENRAWSQSLVGSVFEQARTSDERNIDKFLTTTKWVVAFVVAAFVVPKLAGAK